MPPGLETIALFEFRAWHPHLPTVPRVVKGGIEVELPLLEGLALNTELKVPSRILLRLLDFGCRDFPKFFKKIKNFDWAPWLSTGLPVQAQVSSHRSRLAIKRRIHKTCLEALAAAGFTVSDQELAQTQEIYVRFIDDICTVSLDTSGAHLHRRGFREFVGEAPIRENLAAAVNLALQFPPLLLPGLQMDRLLESMAAAVAQPAAVLFDPMMGSGTLLMEAALLEQKLDKRDYAFARFPGVKVEELAPRISQLPKRFKAYFGADRDAKALSAAKQNLRLLQGLVSAESFTFRHADVFQELPQISDPLWIILNPPYDERLEIKEGLPSFINDLLKRLEPLEAFRIGLILPQRMAKLELPSSYRHRGVLPFENGGLAVSFHILERQAKKT